MQNISRIFLWSFLIIVMFFGCDLKDSNEENTQKLVNKEKKENKENKKNVESGSDTGNTSGGKVESGKSVFPIKNADIEEVFSEVVQALHAPFQNDAIKDLSKDVYVQNPNRYFKLFTGKDAINVSVAGQAGEFVIEIPEPSYDETSKQSQAPITYKYNKYQAQDSGISIHGNFHVFNRTLEAGTSDDLNCAGGSGGPAKVQCPNIIGFQEPDSSSDSRGTVVGSGSSVTLTQSLQISGKYNAKLDLIVGFGGHVDISKSNYEDMMFGDQANKQQFSMVFHYEGKTLEMYAQTTPKNQESLDLFKKVANITLK